MQKHNKSRQQGRFAPGPLEALCGIDSRCATRYILWMIKSFRYKGLEKFYSKGSKSGIPAKHAKKLRMQLAALDSA